jgi:hypothetical protein
MLSFPRIGISAMEPRRRAALRVTSFDCRDTRR